MTAGFKVRPSFPRPDCSNCCGVPGLRTGQETHKTSVLNTLTHICQGGIYDHLGGGFARYSVDHRWLAPHFEKMLYDNAQLVELLTLVWQDTGNPLFLHAIEETIDWLEREMIAESGGLAASLDADSEGVEGKFYVWSKAEVGDLLEPDEAECCAGSMMSPSMATGRRPTSSTGCTISTSWMTKPKQPWQPHGTNCSPARQTDPARVGRQGPDRLERTDDCRIGQRIGSLRADPTGLTLPYKLLRP